MGAFAGVFFFFCLLFFGLTVVAAGIVGLILFGKKRKKTLVIISAFVLTFGIVLSGIPIGFFTFIIGANATPPDDFVETEIVIEENGHQYERFTADGVVYQVLDGFEAAVEADDMEAIFSYKEEGFLNRYQWGNYYRLENEQGFHLVFDWGNSVFCPANEQEQILAYYEDKNNLYWHCVYWTEEDDLIPLTGDVAQIINLMHQRGENSTQQKHLPITDEEEINYFELCAYNREHNLIIERNQMLYYQDKMYQICDDMPYEGGIDYTVVEVPEYYTMVLLQTLDAK